MGNMIDYVRENGCWTFDERPFSEVDSLVLSQLSYLNFQQDNSVHLLKELFVQVPPEQLTEGTFNPSANEELIAAIAGSKRFGSISSAHFVIETDSEAEKQFCAVTFRLSESLHYIAFRGTDASLIGWKEDFNLAFSKSVPSQKAAAAYFRNIAQKYAGFFILGGHSKGGNLAVYAAVTAEKNNRIIAVYNHDGPGFLPEVFALDSYRAMSSRIHKTVPQTAVVGLILEQHEHYTVVSSNSFAFMQHDPFTWIVKDGRFIHIKEVDLLSKYTNRAINSWINSMDTDTRKTFIDALYSIISSANASTFSDLIASWQTNIKLIYSQIKTTDPNVRKLVHHTIAALIKASTNEMIELIKENPVIKNKADK